MMIKKGYALIEICIWVSFSCFMILFIPPTMNSFNMIKLRLCVNELAMNIRNAQCTAINKSRECNVEFRNTEEESFYYIYNTIQEEKKYVLPHGIKFKFKKGNNAKLTYNVKGHPTQGYSIEVTNGNDTYVIKINPNVGRVVMEKC